MSAPGAGARDQVTRLLALVPYLQGKGEISVEDAAREFGVTPKTILGDINVLMFCGLPGLGMGDLIEVDFEALEDDQVIRLSNADYLARPLRLDTRQAAALVVGLRSLLEGSSGSQREVVERTLAKIEDAAGEAARVAERIDLQVPDDGVQDTVRTRLVDAIGRRRQVRLTHRSSVRDELTERTVDPIALPVADGRTYLDAWCHLADDRRLFRLDRVVTAEVLDEPVTRHADQQPLDLRDGIFRPTADSLRATLRLKPHARWVSEYYPMESTKEQRNGDLTVVLRAGDPAWLVRLMLRIGDGATLVEPAELAAEVQERAQEALALYA